MTDDYTIGLHEFIDTRTDWLQLAVMENPGGWDVVLRLDGTYATREDAQEIADYFAEIITED